MTAGVDWAEERPFVAVVIEPDSLELSRDVECYKFEKVNDANVESTVSNPVLAVVATSGHPR